MQRSIAMFLIRTLTTEPKSNSPQAPDTIHVYYIPQDTHNSPQVGIQQYMMQTQLITSVLLYVRLCLL